MSSEQNNYIFGPVPSRRLGKSLGIDIVPLKSCTLDCVYCQLGRSSDLTNERQNFVPVEEVIMQLKARLDEGTKADHITISGSGEPTLNLSLGKVIDEIKKLTKIPVAILTNGTLLYDEAVRRDCAKADVVLPSLDAGDAETFAKINRPHKGMHFERIVDGLVKFREEYKGEIALEVFIVEGINTSDDQLKKMKDIIGRIRPNKVQLNTAVRPTTEPGISAVMAEKMALIAQKIGFGAEVIADYPQKSADLKSAPTGHAAQEGSCATDHECRHSILSMVNRRPCSLEDICSGLNIEASDALRHIATLLELEQVETELKGGKIFYKGT